MESVVPDHPSFAGSLVRMCMRDIAEIDDKPAAGLWPKIDDKRLSPMTIPIPDCRIIRSSPDRCSYGHAGIPPSRSDRRQPVVQDRYRCVLLGCRIAIQKCMETRRADCRIVVRMYMHAGISPLAINPQRVYRRRSTVWHEVD